VRDGRIWAYGFVLFLLGRAAARCIFFTPLGLTFFLGVQSGFCGGKEKVGRGRNVECMC
jgi:hypothetical protein